MSSSWEDQRSLERERSRSLLHSSKLPSEMTLPPSLPLPSPLLSNSPLPLGYISSASEMPCSLPILPLSSEVVPPSTDLEDLGLSSPYPTSPSEPSLRGVVPHPALPQPVFLETPISLAVQSSTVEGSFVPFPWSGGDVPSVGASSSSPPVGTATAPASGPVPLP